MEDLPEDKVFKNSEPVVDDFLLLAFADSKNKLGLDLVGTSMDMRSLIVYNSPSGTLRYSMGFRHKHSRKICTVIPADYNSSGNTSYLLVSREGDMYENALLFKSVESVVQLEKTRAVPMLLSYRDSRPALLFQTTTRSYVLKFEKNTTRWMAVPVDFPALHTMHTSAFIDLTGNMLADLALDTTRSDGRYLEVFKNTGTDLLKAEERRLPDAIGPLCFADFNGSGLVDVAFVSTESGNEYLNIFFNDGPTGFAGGTTSKIDLSNLLAGHKAVITSENFDMPSGIFISDIFSRGVPQIVVAMRSTTSGTTRYLLMKNFGDARFVADTTAFSGVPPLKMASATLVDISNRGAEGLLLNYYENGSYRLDFYNNMVADSNTYHVRVLTHDGNAPKDSYGSALPGVSYQYRSIENNKKYIGFQLAQSSFPHLQHPFVFLGLGTFPYLIEFDGIGLPFYERKGKVFRLGRKIIPNSQLSLHPYRGQMLMYLHFSIAENIKNIFFVLMLILTINAVVLCFLYWKNRRAENEKNPNVLFSFETL